jgi:hypothetical protein
VKVIRYYLSYSVKNLYWRNVKMDLLKNVFSLGLGAAAATKEQV